MNRIVLWVSLLLICLVQLGWGQKSDSIPDADSATQRMDMGITPVYDNFNEAFINPLKWEAWGAWTPNTTEIVREIKGNRLRIAARTYGNRDADQGDVFDVSELNFKNPTAITSFGTRVVVSKVASLPCANNTEDPYPRMQIIGNFFHVGTDETDIGNVDGIVEIRTEPPGNELIVRFIVGVVGGDEIGMSDLGTVNIGEEVFVFLRWDRKNHRFLGGMKKPGSPQNVVSIPYTISDTTPPNGAYKGISVRNTVPNCVDRLTVAGMEAFFDDVMVNVPWAP